MIGDNLREQALAKTEKATKRSIRPMVSNWWQMYLVKRSNYSVTPFEWWVGNLAPISMWHGSVEKLKRKIVG